MTIVIGWWIIPTFITILAWGWAMSRRYEQGGYLPDMSVIFYGGAALIVTLFAWMVYGLLT